MPSTFTTSLGLTLPATGELSGTWGSTVNDGVTSLLDAAVAGTTTITIGGSDYTLTTTQGAANEARRMFLIMTGSPGAARNVIIPGVSKLYFVHNNTSDGFAQTVKTAAGTGVAVPSGARMVLFCNGTNVFQAVNSVGDLSYSGALTGGTGAINIGSGQIYKDAAGLVGIGTASPLALFSMYANSATDVVDVRTDGSNRDIFFRRFGGPGGASIGGLRLNLTRAHGTSAVPVAVTTGATCGIINFTGYAGPTTQYAQIASIQSEVQNFVSETETYGFLSFSTNNGSTSASERMRLTAAGSLGINSSNPPYLLYANGTFGFAPGSSVTPSNNGDVVIEATNNTTLTFKLRGSDGTVRSGTLTLS